MRVTRRELGIAVGVLVVGGALVLGAVYRETDPAGSEQAAEQALSKLERRSTREVLESRCRPDGGGADSVTRRACAALQELAGLDNEPLAAATRLSELSRSKPASPVVAEVQALRVELLLTAGHSREAAHEAQVWAEARRTEASAESIRLWVDAARAQRAIGDEDAARADARQALQLARRAK